MEGKVDLDGNEAVLVEEGVKWFENLCKDAAEASQNQMDKFALVTHAFMLELGFSVENPKALPENRKTTAGHTSRYFYPPSSDFDVILTVTSLGPMVKIHGTHTTSKSTFSTSKLKPSEFITEKEGIFEYKNLRRMARVFKNEIGVPLLNSVRTHLGFATTGLLGVPPEISLKIFKYLDVQSLLRLGGVSKQLSWVCKEKNIWRQIFLRDFGSRSFAISRFTNTLNNSEEEDWLSLYKEHYLNKKEQESSRSRIPPAPSSPSQILRTTLRTP
eukprot:TRINITY_DN7838_c0_g1_i1.p1 TRINITY_DN7838_c0_g1~~TRINITY_DN7838_c0_g1_i1.p1  ORF type:complete len:272 (-),score=65.66 TRINITY_DN7838_c0_g1_i1:81-896(-)